MPHELSARPKGRLLAFIVMCSTPIYFSLAAFPAYWTLVLRTGETPAIARSRSFPGFADADHNSLHGNHGDFGIEYSPTNRAIRTAT